MLEVNDQAPLFEGVTDAEETLKLSDFKGQKVVLYFYPKDNTPGCTTEACDFRENIAAFNKLNVAVIGVSKDSVASHKKFKEKYQLNFPLIADTEGEICQKYGVWREKSMFGKKYMGIERVTYLIDENGKIEAVWPKVKVSQHINDIFAALDKNG